MAEDMNKARDSEILYEQVANMDSDKAYWFKLRGDNPNKMIDAATPLLGLSLRIRSLAQCHDVESIYKQVQEEVKAIELELQQAEIEHAVIMAYRYVLCAVLDEAVMSTSWGTESYWAEHSLLTRFHNETWGGEKVFTILSRLLENPERYKLLLEFIYLCLMLGFEGKYKVVDGGREERERVAVKLYDVLISLDESKEIESLTSAKEHVVATKYRLSSQMPVWSVFAGCVCLLTIVFILYRYLLNTKSLDVLEQLNQIL